MIEAGLVLRINSDAAVKALIASPGGFTGVPKGQPLPTWTYRWVSDNTQMALCSVTGLTFARVQIDCYGNQKAEVVNLGKAITQVLNGFKGTLTDIDNIIVDSIFRSDMHDPEEDEAGRTWRRVLEFEVNYVSQ